MEGKEAKELKIKRFNTALNQDYRNIAPAVKYRRFYLPKFPFAALSSIDVARCAAFFRLADENLFCEKFVDI